MIFIRPIKLIAILMGNKGREATNYIRANRPAVRATISPLAGEGKSRSPVVRGSALGGRKFSEHFAQLA